MYLCFVLRGLERGCLCSPHLCCVFMSCLEGTVPVPPTCAVYLCLCFEGTVKGLSLFPPTVLCICVLFWWDCKGAVPVPPTCAVHLIGWQQRYIVGYCPLKLCAHKCAKCIWNVSPSLIDRLKIVHPDWCQWILFSACFVRLSWGIGSFDHYVHVWCGQLIFVRWYKLWLLNLMQKLSREVQLLLSSQPCVDLCMVETLDNKNGKHLV